MPTARVVFDKCIQDSQNYGNDEEHMVSRIFFTIEVEGRRYEGLHVDVKQTVGSSYKSGPIEVGAPKGAGYKGPFNHEAFRAAVEKYYRSLVGSTGKGISINGSAKNIRMRNNTFQKEAIEEFEVSGPDVSW